MNLDRSIVRDQLEDSEKSDAEIWVIYEYMFVMYILIYITVYVIR